ncbi:class I SAM-dependent methyltransferase [Streptomyces sp. URMC 124]|uniref:class I SAM-dependent methyltransferase n=1 Tax=Streptomyces sp. URMC 124 TaxID=3423405 RepID=UPI003F1DC4B4
MWSHEGEHDPPQHPALHALGAVAQTSLWTLYHRAAAATRTPPLLADPMAVELAARYGRALATRFGPPSALAEQYLALRARMYDTATIDFLQRHPAATVITLGEGMETQFWRVDNGTARWLSVDQPEVIELRRALLPHGPRQHTIACSVTDPRWTGHPVAEPPVLIVAQGLLMYLKPAQAAALVRLCTHRFPRSVMLYDTLPRAAAFLAGRVLSRGGTFRFPTLHGTPGPFARQLTRAESFPRRSGITVRSIGPYAVGPRALARPVSAAQALPLVRTMLLPALIRLDIP